MNVCPGGGVAYDSHYNETDCVTNHITITFTLTNHSSIKLSSILRMEKSIITTTGTFTRVKLSSNKINKSYHRNFRIVQLIPGLFLPS